MPVSLQTAKRSVNELPRDLWSRQSTPFLEEYWYEGRHADWTRFSVEAYGYFEAEYVSGEERGSFEMSKEDFRDLFGKHITELTEALGEKKQYLHRSDLWHLSLTDSVHDHQSYNEPIRARDWKVKKVWMADGRTRGETKGAVYASDDNNHVYRIDLYTMRFELTHSPSSRSSYEKECKFWPGNEERVLMYWWIYSWCRKNKGRALILDHAGARGKSSSAVLHHVMMPSFLYYQYSGEDCASRAHSLNCAVANGMMVLVGDKYAREWFLQVGTANSVRCLAQVSKTLRRYALSLEAVHDKRGKVNPGIAWIAARTRGVYIIDFRATVGFLHCVCVLGDSQLILDSREKTQMRLSVPALKACIGDSNEIHGVEELREMVIHKKVEKASRGNDVSSNLKSGGAGSSTQRGTLTNPW